MFLCQPSYELGWLVQ